MLLSDGLARMAIISRFSTKRIPEWKEFCKTLTHTTDLFLMATLVRSVFDMVTDPEMYRILHGNQLYLVNHLLEREALAAFRESIVSRQTWLTKHYGKKVSKDAYTFASMHAKLLHDACIRTISIIDQQLKAVQLHERFVEKTYTLRGPHNGHPDGTEVVCIAALSESALKVRPTDLTGGNTSGFHVDLSDLKAVDSASA